MPEQHEPSGPVTWSTVSVEGADGLAARAGRKLVATAQVNERFNPEQVRMQLDGPLAPLWDQGHVEASRLWDTFSRYLYLPRLVDQHVLLAAVADGPASLTWLADGFALASVLDGGRYRGLVAGERGPAATASTLIVRPEVALAQRANEQTPASETPGGVEPATGGAMTGAPGSVDATVIGTLGAGREPGRPRRFWATVDMDTERLVRDLGQLNQELISQLSRLDGARVRVRIEIEAEDADGFADATVRTVTENARTLKVTDADFETS